MGCSGHAHPMNTERTLNKEYVNLLCDNVSREDHKSYGRIEEVLCRYF